MDPQTIIARRVALELHAGKLVNLGIGIPTLVANYVPRGPQRLLPVRERPRSAPGRSPNRAWPIRLLTDAGGRPISALPGACTFDSAMSFGLIRGGHVDMTVLGGLQVDADGPSRQLDDPRQDGAGHGRRDGSRRAAPSVSSSPCSTPRKANRRSSRKCGSAADIGAPVRPRRHRMAVMGFDRGKISLLETAPGVSVAEVMAVTEAELIVPEKVPEMKI